MFARRAAKTQKSFYRRLPAWRAQHRGLTRLRNSSPRSPSLPPVKIASPQSKSSGKFRSADAVQQVRKADRAGSAALRAMPNKGGSAAWLIPSSDGALDPPCLLRTAQTNSSGCDTEGFLPSCITKFPPGSKTARFFISALRWIDTFRSHL